MRKRGWAAMRGGGGEDVRETPRPTFMLVSANVPMGMVEETPLKETFHHFLYVIEETFMSNKHLSDFSHAICAGFTPFFLTNFLYHFLFSVTFELTCKSAFSQ